MATGLPETLVGDSTIYLFGRVMDDLKLVLPPDVYRIGEEHKPGEGEPRRLRRPSPNHLVVDQLRSPNALIAASMRSPSRTSSSSW